MTNGCYDLDLGLVDTPFVCQEPCSTHLMGLWSQREFKIDHYCIVVVTEPLGPRYALLRWPFLISHDSKWERWRSECDIGPLRLCLN